MWPRSYVVGMVGIRGAIALESNAGFREKCCVAVCELARSFAGYKLRPGLATRTARAPLSLVSMRSTYAFIVVTYRDYVSLLPAITVARRARIIALIVPARELDTRVTRAVKNNFRAGPYLPVE